MLPKLPAPTAPVEPAQREAVDAGSGEKVAGPAGPGRRARVRLLMAVCLAGALVVGAVVLAVGNHSARARGPLANEAFVDAAATTEAAGQVTAAIKKVYSYDYRTLDANESAAREVMTGKFAESFDRVFAAVKQLAPGEQAVLTTTVGAAGVLQLQNGRARLLMMVDQRGTRQGNQQIAGTSARLIVQAQLVDGRWKVAEVTPE